MKYRLYLLYKHEWGELEITSKGKCDVRGHWIYYLKGKHDGHNVSGNVAKDVWERFDVPIEQSKVKKKYKRNYQKALNNEIYHHSKIPRAKKRNYDEQIEKWIAEKYNIPQSILQEKEENE